MWHAAVPIDAFMSGRYGPRSDDLGWTLDVAGFMMVLGCSSTWMIAHRRNPRTGMRGRATRVPRLTFFAVLGAVIAQGVHHPRGFDHRFPVLGGV
jgi:hypothetical protein